MQALVEKVEKRRYFGIDAVINTGRTKTRVLSFHFALEHFNLMPHNLLLEWIMWALKPRKRAGLLRIQLYISVQWHYGGQNSLLAVH